MMLSDRECQKLVPYFILFHFDQRNSSLTRQNDKMNCEIMAEHRETKVFFKPTTLIKKLNLIGIICSLIFTTFGICYLFAVWKFIKEFCCMSISIICIALLYLTNSSAGFVLSGWFFHRMCWQLRIYLVINICSVISSCFLLINSTMWTAFYSYNFQYQNDTTNISIYYIVLLIHSFLFASSLIESKGSIF